MIDLDLRRRFYAEELLAARALVLLLDLSETLILRVGRVGRVGQVGQVGRARRLRSEGASASLAEVRADRERAEAGRL